jgi:hypothetical protein
MIVFSASQALAAAASNDTKARVFTPAVSPSSGGSSPTTPTAGSTSDILIPMAKDSTGTTLFDAAAPAFISRCNLTNAQSDVSNGTSILLSPHDIQVNHWPALNIGTYVCVVDMVRPPLVIK